MSKKTTIKAPILRFSQFHDEWVDFPFFEIVELRSERVNPVNEKQIFKDIELESIESGTGRLLGINESGGYKSIKNRFYENDILFGKLRPYLNKYLKTSFGGVCSSEIWVMHNKSQVTSGFLYLLVQGKKFQKATNIQSGSKMPRADWDLVKNETFNIPCLAEQEKIAEFFSNIDEWIASLRFQKTNLEKYRIGVLQKMYSQKIRFKDKNGKQFPEWNEVKLGDLFNEVTEKVGSRKVETYSITAGVGFVSQKDKFGRDISGKQNDKYVVLKPGQFSYNKGNSKSYKFGCAYVNDFDFEIAVPNVFISFELADKSMDVVFFSKLFESHYLDKGLRRIISSGARMDGLLNVSKKEFFKLSIMLPRSYDEQHKIASFLSPIDKLIDNKQKQIEQVKQWKKGLLQQMLV